MELQEATDANPNHTNLELIAKLGIDASKCYTYFEKRSLMQN